MANQVFKIGDVCTIIKGTSHILKTEPGEYPLVVTAEYRRTASTYQIEGPAVCVPLISSTGHGDATMHRVHYQEGKFALANLLVALIPKNPNICNARYLYHLLMAKKDKYFVPLMLGTANVSLKERDITNVEIPLPLFSEQQRIVTKIEELSKRVKEVHDLKQSIENKSHKLLLSIFNRLISEAELKSMIEVAPVIRRPVQVDINGDYPELGIRSFGKGTFHKISLKGFEVGSKRLYHIEPGDLVFNNVFAWEGAVAVAKREDIGRVGSHRFITCVPKNGMATSNFLCFYFLTKEGLKKLGEASPGGAGRNRTLGLEALSKITVPILPIEKQIWFDKLQTKIDSVKTFQSQTQKELNALMPSILDKAFKGDL